MHLSPRSKNKKAQKLWRERLKGDPSKYKEHREYETLRVKAFRASMNLEQKQKYNEKTKLRMKKYREKMKKEGQTNNKTKHPNTRKANEKQREIWRKNKQQQRLEMTAQKKRRINERRVC